MILAEDKARGIPPPGCTLPPTKYNSLMVFEKFACLKNAAYLLLEEFPYKAPCAEDVFSSILLGSKIASVSIKDARSQDNILETF
jgi:hypothetical protein